MRPWPIRTDTGATLRAWWRQYTAGPAFWEKRPDYPPLVENYLRAMLAKRLNLPLPGPPQSETWLDQFTKDLGLTMGTEGLRINYQREQFLGPAASREAVDQPLPSAIHTPEPETPAAPGDVRIEPIAQRVPSECLYVRFGSFSNFLWFQDTLAQWRGDLENLVASRGLDYDTSGHFQKQLAVETTTMARLLGGALVDDVAILGSDLFFREGGAYGLLFLARNSMLLGADFNRQRQDRVRNNGCTESKIQIAGREVSYLSSPDGGTRSFYATDGDYHCITTSRWIVQRFLETGSGQKCLSRSKEFRYARSLMPLSRNDTVFAYLSSDFFANLVGPRYRIEGMRRMQAEADIELVQLALLAAAAEKSRATRSSSFAPASSCRPLSARGPTAAARSWRAARSATRCAAGAGSSRPSRISRSRP